MSRAASSRLAAHEAAPLAVAIAALAAYNVVRTLWIPEYWSLITNLAMAVVVAGLALWARLTSTQLGLHEDHHPRGAVWGGAALLLVFGVVAAYAIVSQLRGSSGGTLDDPRLQVPFRDMLYEVLVNTPLGTVALEELAFRGLLLALLLRRTTTIRAVAFCSLLFGAWHILPSLTTAVTNGATEQVASTPLGLVLVVAGNVLATGVAGAVFCWLRLRSGSLLAPALAHLGVNDISYVVGWLFNYLR